MQFMVKDSRKYTPANGWGIACFDDVKPATRKTRFPCHEIVKARDLVFNHYSA
jgi:hypothetical protein